MTNQVENTRIAFIGAVLAAGLVFSSGVVVGRFHSRTIAPDQNGLIEYLAAPPLDPCSAEWIKARATQYAVEGSNIPTSTPTPPWGPEQRA